MYAFCAQFSFVASIFFATVFSSCPSGYFTITTSSDFLANYIGCYADDPSRGLPTFLGNPSGDVLTKAMQCLSEAQSNGCTLVGLQYQEGPSGGECWCGTSLSQAEEWGICTGGQGGGCVACTTNAVSGGTLWWGHSWSNAVYSACRVCSTCPAGQFQVSACSGTSNTVCINTVSPTQFPTAPTKTPSLQPTSPTHRPTHPTNSPSVRPTTRKPSLVPTKKPTLNPTSQPTYPTVLPTSGPSFVSNSIGSFQSTQFIVGASQLQLQNQSTIQAFTNTISNIIRSHYNKTVGVTIHGVTSVTTRRRLGMNLESTTTYGYFYNITYLVINGSPSGLVNKYANLTSVISRAVTAGTIANFFESYCAKLSCSLSGSTVSIGSTSFAAPVFITTMAPSAAPTLIPSSLPSTGSPSSPSSRPSLTPTSPTLSPTKKPSSKPSVRPSRLPTIAPSLHSLAPTIQGQCFCNVRNCLTHNNVTQCAPQSTQTYHM